MHFMLQREVVARMAAGPGSKAYGRLTVMLAAACRVEALFDIGPGAFRPPPRVWSSWCASSPGSEPPFPIRRPGAFRRGRPARLRAAPQDAAQCLSGLVDEDAIRAAGCDPGARAETLPPEAFASPTRRP
jgi:16S rRNA (adenine1518-N6/adenine1519-N6)-dimethyltransferase